jgi:DNA-binding response OmpR family regulator
MKPEAKKVLIIDDEQEICEMLYSFLVPHNYKVFLAFNGQMGLEYFEEIKPDIVLLDLKMPDIDGIEVLKIIRKVSEVPVVVITGHPQDVSDIHLADLKIEGYIEKPISLLAVLNSLKFLVGE